MQMHSICNYWYCASQSCAASIQNSEPERIQADDFGHAMSEPNYNLLHASECSFQQHLLLAGMLKMANGSIIRYMMQAIGFLEMLPMS